MTIEQEADVASIHRAAWDWSMLLVQNRFVCRVIPHLACLTLGAELGVFVQNLLLVVDQPKHKTSSAKVPRPWYAIHAVGRGLSSGRSDPRCASFLSRAYDL
jgi:hypothetical protein